MTSTTKDLLIKVPAITLGFWIIKILCTIAQVKSKTFQPWLYWATIIASTTAGTTLATSIYNNLDSNYTATGGCTSKKYGIISLSLESHLEV